MAMTVGEAEIRLKIDDSAVKSGLAKVKAETEAAGTSAASSFTAVARKLRDVGSLEYVGRTLSMYVTLPLAAAAAGAVKLSSDFQDAMAKVVGLAGLPIQAMKGMESQIVEISNKSGIAATDLANSLYFATSAGIRGAKAMDVVATSAKMSEVGMGTAADSANVLTSVLAAYKGTSITAAQAADILTMAVRDGKTTVSDFSGALGKVVPIAAEMKIPFSDVAASMAAMTREGLNAQIAATSLRQIFVTLLHPSKQTVTALDSVGLSAAALRNEMKSNLLGALLEINQAFDKNETAISQVFPNVRALTGVLSILGQNAQEVSQVFYDTANASGTLANAVKVAEDTTGFAVRQAKAHIENALIELGDQMAPAIKNIASELSRLADGFSKLSPGVKAVVAEFLTLVAAIGPATLMIGAFARAMVGLNAVKMLFTKTEDAATVASARNTAATVAESGAAEQATSITAMLNAQLAEEAATATAASVALEAENVATEATAVSSGGLATKLGLVAIGESAMAVGARAGAVALGALKAAAASLMATFAALLVIAYELKTIWDEVWAAKEGADAALKSEEYKAAQPISAAEVAAAQAKRRGLTGKASNNFVLNWLKEHNVSAGMPISAVDNAKARAAFEKQSLAANPGLAMQSQQEAMLAHMKNLGGGAAIQEDSGGGGSGRTAKPKISEAMRQIAEQAKSLRTAILQTRQAISLNGDDTDSASMKYQLLHGQISKVNQGLAKEAIQLLQTREAQDKARAMTQSLNAAISDQKRQLEALTGTSKDKISLDQFGKTYAQITSPQHKAAIDQIDALQNQVQAEKDRQTQIENTNQAVRAQISQMTREIALFDAKSQVQQVTYELTTKEYAGASAAQKERILGLAKEIDSLDAKKEAEQESAKAAQEAARQIEEAQRRQAEAANRFAETFKRAMAQLSERAAKANGTQDSPQFLMQQMSSKFGGGLSGMVMAATYMKKLFDVQKAEQFAKQLDLINEKLSEGLTNALDKAFRKGFKGFFSNVIQGFDQMLAQMAQQWIKSQLMSYLTKVIGQGLGGLFGKGGHAVGGWAEGGVPTLVGEYGPELFVPNGGGGRVMTADETKRAMNAGAQQIHVHIQTPDIHSFHRSQTQIASTIAGTLAMASRRNGA